MPKKYILKQMESGYSADRVGGRGGNRPLERNLLNLSALGIKWNTDLIKQIRTDTEYQGINGDQFGAANPNMTSGDYFMRAHNGIAGQNDYIAYYDQTYQMRRDFLRKFAMQPEINYVVETIADEVIVNDKSHFFAYPDTRQLRSILKPENGKIIVDAINQSYKRIYNLWHFNEGNDAWQYVKQLLTEGFLAFEIIFSDTENRKVARDIEGFKWIDPVTLQPEIRIDEQTKHEYKAWVINKGDKEKERVLPDTNVIYISWAKANTISTLSYCEQLIKPFNTLRTLENSRIIWNVQNAQKRIKFVVPVGSASEQHYMTRLRELEAYYKEDIQIDDFSGELLVNGQPKFSFAKNFVFPSKEGTSTEISELGVEGHDLNSTEQLKFFWQKFMFVTGLPKDRFNMFFDGQENSIVPDTGNMTREEYRYKLFIGRVRDLYQEMLTKPTWIQFCLHHPNFASNNVIKNAVGLDFVEENVFAMAKEIANLKMGVDAINTLNGIQGADGKPKFSMKFLTQRYLNFSDDDWALNEKMLADEAKEAEAAGAAGGAAAAAPAGGDLGGGFDFGGGGDMGGGFDFSGGEGVGETSAAPEPAPAPEAPAPEA